MKKYHGFDYVEMGKRIAERRNELSISQKKLAESLGCEYYYISRIETGKARPSLGMVQQIAIVLGVGVDYFVPGTKVYVQIMDAEIAEELKECTPGEKRFIKEFIVRFKKFGMEVAKEYED